MKKTYNVNEIFHEIPDDPENIMMTIPPEVCEKMGWKPGDEIKVTTNEDGSISIKKVTK
jgi:AbrB family looped-hinge helix DNA binding protein